MQLNLCSSRYFGLLHHILARMNHMNVRYLHVDFSILQQCFVFLDMVFLKDI